MKRCVLILSVIFAFLFSGCSLDRPEEYEIRQEIGNIVSVEILKQNSTDSEWDERFTVRGALTQEQYAEILEQLREVDGTASWNPPHTEFGPFVIRITYTNADTEWIGRYNNLYITADGIKDYGRYFFRDGAGFHAVISQFLNEDILAEAEEWTGF